MGAIISSVNHKTAQHLAHVALNDDGYHRAIQRAAKTLRSRWPRRDWQYIAQSNDRGGIATTWRLTTDRLILAKVVLYSDGRGEQIDVMVM